MELLYDANNPPVGVIGVDILDNGFSSMSLQPTDYFDEEVPGYGNVHPFYLNPIDRLYPFRDLTSQIYYLWNNFEPEQKTYVKTKFGSFHPLDDMFYDPNYSYDWDDLFRFWHMNGEYINNNRNLNDDGWYLVRSLRDYMNEIADETLKKLVKKECCTRDKKVAEAIWDIAHSRVKDINVSLDKIKIQDIIQYFKKNNSSSFSMPDETEIKEKFLFMQKCHAARSKKSGFEIEKFYEKIVRQGFKGAPDLFKKYLLLKKKYLDKKTLKKL